MLTFAPENGFVVISADEIIQQHAKHEMPFLPQKRGGNGISTEKQVQSRAFGRFHAVRFRAVRDLHWGGFGGADGGAMGKSAEQREQREGEQAAAYNFFVIVQSFH